MIPSLFTCSNVETLDSLPVWVATELVDGRWNWTETTVLAPVGAEGAVTVTLTPSDLPSTLTPSDLLLLSIGAPEGLE